jgi:hypothetical protein
VSLEQQLAGWTGPSSTTEQEKQERTERMICEAIAAHPPFKDCSLSVYAKASYPNNTNVRTDSDVDIAVQCSDVLYYEEHSPGAHPPGTQYTGPWTPAKLRAETVAALTAKFGDQLDMSGTTAIRVNSSTARVDADVVPCFDFRDYYETFSRDGSRILRKNGDCFENYPKQHLANWRAKNTLTNGRCKSVVRILKRVENAMVVGDVHRDVPSFFVECLTYNCPKPLFDRYTWTDRVKGVLVHIWEDTQGDIEPGEDRWLEVNDAKYLFHFSQAWSRKDGRDFAYAAWNYLGFGA